MRPLLARDASRSLTGAVQLTHDLTVSLADSLAESVADAKPHLRGWLHLGLVPLALVGGIVLVAMSPTNSTRAGSAVFVASAVLLFGVSAAYHRGNWSPSTWRVLRHLDHCNIFVLIAGSCTAYALLMLNSGDRQVLLALVWGSAGLGVVARFIWPDAPRGLSAPVYVLSGCGAFVFIPGFVDGAVRLGAGVGAASLTLMATGGVLYVGGAVVYGLRRPDPWPRWFGFHEVFHALTVLAFASHYVGVSLATYSMR